MFRYSTEFGEKGVILLVLLVAGAFLTVHPLLTVLAVAFPFIAAKLLWRKNEPPLLFVAFVLQWVQVTIKVFYADGYKVPLSAVYEFPEHIVQAYCLSLFGLLVQCIGIWFVLRNLPCLEKKSYTSLVQQYNLKKITIAYVLAILIYPILTRYAFVFGGLQQFIQKIADLKWALFLLLYIITFLKQKNKQVFYCIIIIEVILGFTGYFSSFKEFFMFIAIAYAMLHQSFRLKQVVLAGAISIILFNLFVIWQYVKPEYRKFLSGGETAQVVKVSKKEALEKLIGLVGSMDTTAYNEGITRLVDRTTYIDYFSAAIAYVPEYVPHENGALWWGALVRIFTPRIFFPNKPVIDDSEKAQKYTGLKFAGAAEGTSITLGYMAESYVDFGSGLMFIPLLFFGMMLGLMYKFIITTSVNPLWGLAFLFPFFFQVNLFEMALDKQLGGIIAYFLVLLLVRKFVIPHIDRFFTINGTR